MLLIKDMTTTRAEVPYASAYILLKENDHARPREGVLFFCLDPPSLASVWRVVNAHLCSRPSYQDVNFRVLSALKEWGRHREAIEGQNKPFFVVE